MMTFLYKSEPVRGAAWKRLFAERLPDLTFRTWPDTGPKQDVRYFAAWEPPDDLADFPNLEILFSVGAGVDQLDLARLPERLSVVRMIEPGLVAGMVEYVVFSVLALFRGMPAYLDRQRRADWKPDPVPEAGGCTVGIMGLGVLGSAALDALRPFGFPLRAWSRSPRVLAGATHFAGTETLPAFLAECDILVCLLPLTDGTRGILDADLFARLPKGAAVVNAARGAHLVPHDLLAALDGGRLSAAILDVTSPEPLPPGDPLWSHQRIWLTPHVASNSKPESGALSVLANLERHARGEPLSGLVDRSRGY